MIDTFWLLVLMGGSIGYYLARVVWYAEPPVPLGWRLTYSGMAFSIVVMFAAVVGDCLVRGCQ